MAEPHDHLRSFLESIGLDASVDDQLEETPRRVAAMLQQLFDQVDSPPPPMSLFDADGDGAVHIIGLPFRSMCVHHLVPIFGTIDIAYVPDGTIAGFGSFGRVVDWAAGRPQIQERMVRQIVDVFQEQLAPAGLLVRARARQMCVEMNTGRPGTYVALVARGTMESGPARDAAITQFVAAEQPL